VNLTPPWQNTKDAAVQTGGTGGSTGTIDDSGGGALGTDAFPAGGASGDDALDAGGTGGIAQIDSDAQVGSGGTGGATGAPDAGGTLDTGGTVGSGGVAAGGGAGGTGGVTGKGGNMTGGAGGARATGGSSAAPDAPVDQAQKRDTPSGPEVVSQSDAGVDAPQVPDAPAGADLPTDPAAIPTVGLVAYYPCEQATGAGATLPDLSLKSQDAILTGPTGFAAGQVGNALTLTATNGVDGGASGGYATLPAGIVAGATEITVSTWFKINGTASYDNFERVFDFGTSNATSSMYFTPRNASGMPQFTIRFRPEAGAEIKQDLISTGAATTPNVWHHVAVVLDAAGGHLYVDGVSVESSTARTAMTMRPADLGAMPNSWIGRSEFPNDPYFDGMIDEFRVYTRALSSAEIAILFAAR
jgi:hypothetical protein